jgi:hypothetical protein
VDHLKCCNPGKTFVNNEMNVGMLSSLVQYYVMSFSSHNIKNSVWNQELR